MRIRRYIVPLAVFVAGINSLPVRGQQQDRRPAVGQEIDVVRVETTLVTLPVRVKDRNGKFIPTLQREQFHIYEDGVEQEIAYFEPPREANETSDSSSKRRDDEREAQEREEQAMSKSVSLHDGENLRARPAYYSLAYKKSRSGSLVGSGLISIP